MNAMKDEVKTDRWFLKCTACKKPWAVQLPRVTGVHGGGMLNTPITVRIDETAVHKIAEGDGWRCPTWDRTAQVYRYPGFTACPLCGNTDDTKPHRVMGRVEGKTIYDTTLLPPCDGRCTQAKGPSCDCQCGGKNHGTGRLVEMVTKATKAPTS